MSTLINDTDLSSNGEYLNNSDQTQKITTI